MEIDKTIYTPHAKKFSKYIFINYSIIFLSSLGPNSDSFCNLA